MSAAKASTAGFSEAARMSAAACSARPRSRPVMPTRAPIVASPIAVALPIPPVPPVIRMTLPAIRSVPPMVRPSDGGRPLIGLGLETLEEEPEGQHQLKKETGDGEIQTNVDPEDFSDGPRHENRVADQARNRKPPWDQLGPEQQQAEEYGPDSER